MIDPLSLTSKNKDIRKKHDNKIKGSEHQQICTKIFNKLILCSKKIPSIAPNTLQENPKIQETIIKDIYRLMGFLTIMKGSSRMMEFSASPKLISDLYIFLSVLLKHYYSMRSEP